MNETLEPEVMDGIKPFNGIPQTGTEMIQSGKTIQRVQTGYTTAVAVQKPRSLTEFQNRVLEEAAIAGADFYYSWEVKTKGGGKAVVEGGAIGLAMCMHRNFMNCAIDGKVEETPTHYIFTAVFVDLETGSTITRLFRQRKAQNIGNYDVDRKEDIAFQIGQSKAIRNVILAAMPSWMTKKAIEAAKEAEIAGIQNIADARSKAVKYFLDEFSISKDRVEKVIGKSADDWSAADLAGLKGTITAIKEGRVKPEEAFPPIEKPKTKKEESDEVEKDYPELCKENAEDDRMIEAMQELKLLNIPKGKSPAKRLWEKYESIVLASEDSK
jgi:hypothetical protein